MSNKIIVVQKGCEIETQNISGIKLEWLGNNAILKIHAPFNFSNCTFQIGNSDEIEIFENSDIRNLFIRCASHDSVIKIGKKFSIVGGQFILPNDHNKQLLTIGDNCLFSSSIFIQTSDGHSILDMNGTVLNNNGGSVKIGNHVWLDHGASVLKKASIADNTIVAESAVVSKSFMQNNCILGGVPAKIIKNGVNWSIKSPEIYQKENCKND